MERNQPLRAISPSKDNIFKVCVYKHIMHMSDSVHNNQCPLFINCVQRHLSGYK